MNLHYLQHVPFEGLANLEEWAAKEGFSISAVKLFADQALPDMADVDWLVVMGGPMNIYEEDLYPWLAREKKFIAEAIENNKIVLGICLGAQLISDVLGGKVYRNGQKEIGWFPVSLTPEAGNSTVFASLPPRFMAFHWHGDTFQLAPGATRIAHSDACAIQAFEANGERVIGLQFHLESSAESIRLLIDNCGDELSPAPYIQRAPEIVSAEHYLGEINDTMSALLDAVKRKFA
jgi:GMP synthase-like glutamine amidotransferase